MTDARAGLLDHEQPGDPEPKPPKKPVREPPRKPYRPGRDVPKPVPIDDPDLPKPAAAPSNQSHTTSHRSD
jgi:hypothetical protein